MTEKGNQHQILRTCSLNVGGLRNAPFQDWINCPPRQEIQYGLNLDVGCKVGRQLANG